MDSYLLKLDTVLSPTEDEVPGFVIPQLTWEKGSGGFHFWLVGRLLSHPSVHLNTLKDSWVRLLNTARGVSVRKVTDSRFCLVFIHLEDLRRVLDLRPWVFDHNLVVFQCLALTADPLTMDLDCFPFFVHVHDLLYAQRTVDVLRYISDCLGAWLDVDDNCWHISWFETVRVWTNIDVTVPLKRAHLLRTWLRAVGPVRRMGSMSDTVRPTYVWRSPVVAGSVGSNRRAAHVFGDFQREEHPDRRLNTSAAGNSADSTSSLKQLASGLR
ncbi:hypothetical protein Salat_1103200 [Sesamum alatum]|uniref:DUF4283 domain-containing protein n=1 Tax=Sesamum alatum TaxID=300844 RepID=A0AAE1YN05_9LAMI|nr:hypothetical protein Salat_1103200 [Sesamum alatum]